ncbi:MAG: hypothetical protein ACFFDB_00090 [Promethearchaeota archaeon]
MEDIVKEYNYNPRNIDGIFITNCLLVSKYDTWNSLTCNMEHKIDTERYELLFIDKEDFEHKGVLYSFECYVIKNKKTKKEYFNIVLNGMLRNTLTRKSKSLEGLKDTPLNEIRKELNEIDSPYYYIWKNYTYGTDEAILFIERNEISYRFSKGDVFQYLITIVSERKAKQWQSKNENIVIENILNENNPKWSIGNCRLNQILIKE